ncbi:hypothetical protein STSP_05450 [Streptomyces jeddahensis]|uniref:Uncharacterized protein n=1 Tax=Streptomyces jeddahensis TaxID=1716141 RepID=A0A177HYR9_9ACTN|nr:hypothetical protein STSP_05450 [Streptomyces jeddahensis]
MRERARAGPLRVAGRDGLVQLPVLGEASVRSDPGATLGRKGDAPETPGEFGWRVASGYVRLRGHRAWAVGYAP